MPQKLLLIREHLNISEPVMAQLLELPKKGHVPEYENGVRVPNLMITLAYSRLGKVSMESVVDDEVNVNEFCEQLGKAELSITTQDCQRKRRNKQRKKGGHSHQLRGAALERAGPRKLKQAPIKDKS